MDFGENYMNTFAETVHVFEKNRQSFQEVRLQELQNQGALEWDDFENELSTLNLFESITFNEAIKYFQESDLSEYKDKITMIVHRRKAFLCLPCFKTAELQSEHSKDYELLFLIAKCSYDSNDCKHFSMLRTVYRSLVQEENVDFDWEKIGFQSNSPGTDLRGVGMMGVLQMLYLCLNCSVLMEFLYVSSIDKYNTFPFAAVGLNMTRITLSVLRYGKLNKEINKNGVFEAANKFYASIFYAFGKLWVSKKKTISDVGAMFQDIEKLSARRSNRRKMARDLKVFLKKKCFRDK